MDRQLCKFASAFLLACLMSPLARAQAPGTASWVREQTTRLQDRDPAVQKRARQAILDQAARPGSPAAFIADLNSALSRLLKQKDVRWRVNAGVVAEEVAAKTGSPGLAPVAQEMMRDPSDAIALLGVKTAKYLVANTVLKPKDPLAPAIVGCVKLHPDSGVIAEEAYAALTLKPNAASADPSAGAVKAVLPSLLDLIDIRLDLYGNGPPPSPGAELRAVLFLGVTGTTAVSNDAVMRSRALRSLGDLACVTARAAAEGNSDRGVKDLLRGACASLTLFAPDPDLESATKELQTASNGTPSQNVEEQCGKLGAALERQKIRLRYSGEARPLEKGPLSKSAR